MKNLHHTALIFALFFFTVQTFANVHICPSISAIKQKITDKNLISFKYTKHDHFGGGTSTYSNGVINYFDAFDTNETWVFHFDVDATKRDEVWNLFQNYLDAQPDVIRIAKDKDSGNIDDEILIDGRWVCRYTWEPLDFGTGGARWFNVFAILKAP